jgi:hypothetical protein
MGEKEKMKVKVGDKVYDSLNEPIMLILNDKDKEKISGMVEVEMLNQYCVHPDFMKKAEVIRFIKGEENV